MRPGAVVVIPAYEPDSALVDLARALREADDGLPVLIVDDGSGDTYRDTFAQVERIGCAVEHLASNQGKGAALKHAFAVVARDFPGYGVVCADADGQHRLEDILHLRGRLADSTADMVLGVRELSRRAPLRSRFGNGVTRRLFQLSTGHDLRDTQTGLRAYPARMLPWLCNIPGDRYEYELSLLLRAVEQNLQIEEVPIATVYRDHNSSSHFRTVTDSVRVYAPLLRFSASSVFAFVLDTVLLLILSAATGNLLASVLGARLVSSTVNFGINRLVVFRRTGKGELGTSAARYFTLAGAIVALNYGLISLLHAMIGVPLLGAKIITELVIFCVSFLVQRLYVFRGAYSNRRRAGATGTTNHPLGAGAARRGARHLLRGARQLRLRPPVTSDVRKVIR